MFWTCFPDNSTVQKLVTAVTVTFSFYQLVTPRDITSLFPVCKNDSKVTVQLTDKHVAVYIDDMTVSNCEMKYGKWKETNIFLTYKQ